MKAVRILILMLSIFALPALAGAMTYTFAPYDASGNSTDVFDLDHSYIYIWGIQAPASLKVEKIDSVTLTVKDIYNWDTNFNILKFYLVDNPNIDDIGNQVDIIKAVDNQSQAIELPSLQGTKFTDCITLNTTYTDTNGPITVDQFSYSFSQSEIDMLTNYLLTANTFGENATFGIGFDPDCHFYNNGVELKITTSPVPEPGTVLLLGAGLLGIAGLRLRKRS